MAMRIAYVFRYHPAFLRSTKECNSLVHAGHSVTFIGWDINPAEERRHELRPEVGLSMLKLKSEFGRFEAFKWLRWYWHLLRSLGFRRFDAVQCVDEYPALMLLPFKRILFRWMVMEVMDSIIRRKASTWFKGFVFRSLRWLANWGSDVIIETSEELKATLGKFQKKAVVVYNSPPDPAADVAGIEAPTGGPLMVAVGGMIGKHRMALDTLVAALDLLGPDRVRVLSSGVLGDDYAREVWARHPSVDHRWLDSTRDYFRQLAACDLVYGVRADAEDSYYRSLVFPQKLFDALAVGRPILVGTENWISKWVLEREVGYACSFRDAAGMAAVFAECLARRGEMPVLAQRARRLFREHYDWPIVEKTLLRVYEGLQPAAKGL